MKFAIGEIAIICYVDELTAMHLLGEEAEVIGVSLPCCHSPWCTRRMDYAIRDAAGKTWLCDECCLKKRPPYEGCEPTTWNNEIWAPDKVRARPVEVLVDRLTERWLT